MQSEDDDVRASETEAIVTVRRSQVAETFYEKLKKIYNVLTMIKLNK